MEQQESDRRGGERGPRVAKRLSRSEITKRQLERDGHPFKGKKHSAATKKHLSELAKQRIGEKSNRWLGDKATPTAKKARGRREAQKLYPLPDKCQVCKKAKATERHHKDQDTNNNKKSNIMFVCHPCHLKIDNPRKRKVG